MFGTPSPGKLLVLFAIVVIVWYGLKFVGRLDRERKEAQRVARRPGGRARRAAPIQDMERCGVCGAYVAARAARSCARADCPYPA